MYSCPLQSLVHDLPGVGDVADDLPRPVADDGEFLDGADDAVAEDDDLRLWCCIQDWVIWDASSSLAFKEKHRYSNYRIL